MGHQSIYHISWDPVFEYLKNPGDPVKHRNFYDFVEPLIKHWLLRLGLQQDLDGHAKSIFSDLYLKELKRYRAGKLIQVKCTAKAATYYYPVIRNLCIDYSALFQAKIPFTTDGIIPEMQAQPGVFEDLWGEHKNTVLFEMSRGIQDYIEFAKCEARRKEYLRKRFLDGQKFPEILNNAEKSQFETERKWICRQGKKIAVFIAQKLLPALIDCYRLPISKKIDPKIIEKHLLGSKTKVLI